MKINGKPMREVKNKFGGFTIFQVALKGGPMDKMPSLVGNSTILWANGHRYELNADGDYVYSPLGQN